MSDKDWLDIAWKHFQQHAQQRILYFNFFVVFSTILTTGLITTFQSNFKAQYLGIGFGLIQAFLAFIFWKIDERNKFLTQHSENIIKRIESSNDNHSYKLFSEEEINTKKRLEEDKSKKIYLRQISHGKAFKIIFKVYFCVGILGMLLSLANCLKKDNIIKDEKADKLIIQIDKIEEIKNEVNRQYELLHLALKEIQLLNARNDSLRNIIINIEESNGKDKK